MFTPFVLGFRQETGTMGIGRKTKAEKEREARKNRLCQTALYRKPVSVMKLGEIAKVADDAIVAGDDDAAVLAKLAAFIDPLVVVRA
jgi:hypothetical protein